MPAARPGGTRTAHRPSPEARLRPARAERLRARLLAWYDANRRDLPWRRSRDPYAIWISETMLQQTRVETVIPYYERFLERFPDVQTLADAPEEDVYAHWAGLGYYSRARYLHAAARAVVDDFGGDLPPDANELRSLPGIGRYTAGAVASIAFDRPEPIVDGNVIRVLARILGIREDVVASAVRERIWTEAGALADGERPGDLNQSLMELGALICTPRSPRCLVCPVRRQCDGHRAGDAEELPTRSARPKVERVRAIAVWLRRGSRVLAVKRESGGLLGGLWELPGGELVRGEKPVDAVPRLLGDRLGLAVDGVTAAGRVTHAFTHRALTLYVFRAAARPGRTRRNGYAQHRWVSPEAFRALGRATVTAKAFAALGETADGKEAGDGTAGAARR